MKKSERKKMQVESEWHQVIAIDPLAAAERLLSQFSNEKDKAFIKVDNSTGDEAMRKALLEAVAYYKRWYAFSHELVEATGKGIYRRELKFHRMLTEHERDIWCRVDSRNLPSLPYPPEAREVLERLHGLHKPEPPAAPVEPEYESQTERHFTNMD